MKYALIIGNNKYNDPKLAQLKTPAADSQALAKVLGDPTVGEFDEVVPLINQTESQVRRSISSFLIRKKPDDLVLLYFSGHGVLDDRGRLYLALKDTQVDLLKATSIPSSFLADEMDSCRSKRQILVLDCCHSGAFERGTKGDQKAITETTFEGSGFGRVVLTASDSTQYALEGDQIIKQTELSLFTHFLLEGLKTGEADINNDGYISLDEWYDYTYTKVISETPRQVPHKWSYNQQGDLMIAKNPFVKKRVVELPYELLQALESPFVGIRESAVNELGKYLRSRDTEMMQLAVSSLEKMKQDDSRRISLLAEKLLMDFAQAQAPSVKGSPSLSQPVVDSITEAVPTLERDALPSSPSNSKVGSISQAKLSQTINPSGEFLFSRTFWTKWIGTTVLGTIVGILLVYFLEDVFSLYLFPIQFSIVAGVTGLSQWFVFREHLKWRWIVGNMVVGALLGGISDFLSDASGWSSLEQDLLLVFWIICMLVLAPQALRDKLPGRIVPVETSARRNIVLLLLSISLVLAAVANVLLITERSSEFFGSIYALCAIVTGALYFRNELPRNLGFIALAVYLILHGISVAFLVLNSSFSVYYFAFSGIPALISSVYFIAHKETRGLPAFLLLSGYLLFHGLAGITAPVTVVSYPLLGIASIFAVITAVLFLIRK